MPTTVESLELQVQTNSSSAASGIGALSASLTKLKTAAKGGAGLGAVADQIAKLNAALLGVTTSKIDNLANSLSTLGQIKISSTIANRLVDIGYAAECLEGVDYSGLGKLSDALGPLSAFSAKGFGSTVSALKSIPSAVTALHGVDFDTLATDAKALADALDPLAAKLNAISGAFSALPALLQSAVGATNSLTAANKKATAGYADLWAKCRMAYNAIRSGAYIISSWITSANEYIENLNLFNVALGEYAEEAYNYAKSMNESLGVDLSSWLRYQGVFQTVATGFGIAADKAAYMSQNLTQLGFDLSSYANISVESAMLKVQSGLSGELEPLRALGYDLSVARLQQEALNLGIEESVSDMTQAEKAQLRYYAMLTQVTQAQNDLTRSINAPTNQIRILKSQVQQAAVALGNLFLPALQAILPVATAAAKVVRYLAEALAGLFGFELADYTALLSNLGTSVGGLADSADDAGEGLGSAAENAKKLKNNLLGIDELNIISPDTDAGSGSGSGSGGLAAGGDLGADVPGYEWDLDEVTSEIDRLVEKIKGMLPWIGAVAAGFAAWKIAKGLISGIEKLPGLLKGFGGSVLSFGTVGLSGFLSDMNEFRKFVEDFQANGATFWNVGGMISEFAGMIGDALIMMGNLKLGGALKVIQGVGEIVIAIKDIADSGVSWENARMAVRGLTNVAIGVGTFIGGAKGLAVSGVGLIVQGMLNVVGQIQNVADAIETGNWDCVDKADLLVGAIEAIAGVFVAAKGLTPTLTKVAASAFGATFASALFSGGLAAVVAGIPIFITGVMSSIQDGLSSLSGFLTALGATLTGAGAGAIGAALGAWAGPVGIAIGALVGLIVGALTNFGIWLYQNWEEVKACVVDKWTAIADFMSKVSEKIGSGITAVGNWFSELPGKIYSAASGAVAKIAAWASDMIEKIKTEVPKIIEKIVDFFKELPGELMSLGADIWQGLIDGLANAWGALETAVSDFVSDFIQGFKDALGIKSPSTAFLELGGYIVSGLNNGITEKESDSITEVKEWAGSVVEWFAKGEDGKGIVENFQEMGGNITSGFINAISASYPNVKSGITTWAGNLKSWFTDNSHGGVNNSNWQTYANNIITGFKDKISNAYANAKPSMTTFGSSAKSWFTAYCSQSSFYNIADDVVTGFKNGIGALYATCKGTITSWGSSIISWFKDKLESNSPSKVFIGIGEDIVSGFNLGIGDSVSGSQGIVSKWADSVTDSFQPKMAFAVDTSALSYYDSGYFSRQMTAEVTGKHTVTADGFIDGMEEFYRAYVEPSINRMVNGIETQASKKEQTIVKIGNRTVTDAVVTQQNANGYVFSR